MYLTFPVLSISSCRSKFPSTSFSFSLKNFFKHFIPVVMNSVLYYQKMYFTFFFCMYIFSTYRNLGWQSFFLTFKNVVLLFLVRSCPSFYYCFPLASFKIFPKSDFFFNRCTIVYLGVVLAFFLSCLGFAESFMSVGWCFSPNLGYLVHYFFKHFFFLLYSFLLGL